MDKVGRCSVWWAWYVQRLGHLETAPWVWGSADVSALIPEQGYRTHSHGERTLPGEAVTDPEGQQWVTS